MRHLRQYLSVKRKKLEKMRGERRLFNTKFMTHFSDTQCQTELEAKSDETSLLFIDEKQENKNEETEAISKDGYLQRKSLIIGKFRKRFICLNDNHLYCYKNHKQIDLTENIDLTLYKQAVLSETMLAQFELIPVSDKHKMRVFIAESIDDAQEWVNKINLSAKPFRKSDKNELKQKQKENVFCFGEKHHYWTKSKGLFSKSGKYGSIKEEVISNKIYSITMDQFKEAHAKAKYLTHKSPNIKNLKWDGLSVYKLKKGDSPSVEYILSVVLYTDYDSLSYHFSATFRKMISNESIQMTNIRHKEFWNWSKTLIETVNSFGTSLVDSNITIFYHGISLLYFNTFIARFNSPVSTTTKLAIAYQFASKNGLILEIGQEVEHGGFLDAIRSYSGMVKYFNCAFVSCFANEDERLFIQPPQSASSRFCLQLLSIRNISSDESYGKYITALITLQKLTGCHHFDDNWNVIKNENMKVINDMILFSLGKSNRNIPRYVIKLLEISRNDETWICICIGVIKKAASMISIYEGNDNDIIRIDQLCVMFKNVRGITLDYWRVKIPNMERFQQSILSMLHVIDTLPGSKLEEIQLSYVDANTIDTFNASIFNRNQNWTINVEMEAFGNFIKFMKVNV
eukprot:262882_1